MNSIAAINPNTVSSSSAGTFLPMPPVSKPGATNSGGVSSTANTTMAIGQTVMDVAAINTSGLRDEDKITATRDRIGLAVADYYSGGLASVAYGYMNEHWGGFMNKLRSLDEHTNPFTILCMKLFSSDEWKTEGNRLGKLLKDGIDIPPELQGARQMTRGRTREELIDPSVAPDFIGVKSDGTWVNNVFAATREASALQPEDIWGYSAFFEKFGNDWLGNLSGEQRKAIAAKALELGCVKEHHGTIDVQWTPELEAAIGNIRRPMESPK